MSAIEHKAWGKTPRLFRDMVITEKIDGTNCAVIVKHISEVDHSSPVSGVELFEVDARYFTVVNNEWVVGAQSRNRLIRLGKSTDNFGFAAWVCDNAWALAEALGEGYHYGEWWGSKIARNYGLVNERRFSLFDVVRYADVETEAIPGLGLVPELYRGTFEEEVVHDAIEALRDYGSLAEPEFMDPEGVIVFHEASGQAFKVLLKDDELPKGLVA